MDFYQDLSWWPAEERKAMSSSDETDPPQDERPLSGEAPETDLSAVSCQLWHHSIEELIAFVNGSRRRLRMVWRYGGSYADSQCCGGMYGVMRATGCNMCFRLDNSAEKLFKEMEEKNGDTYEALIQGLVKVSDRAHNRQLIATSGVLGNGLCIHVQHKNYRRAFQVFDEMRRNGFQGVEKWLETFVKPSWVGSMYFTS